MNEPQEGVSELVADSWPVRPWLLAGGLGLAGLLVHFASSGGEDDPWRMALTAFVFFGSLVAAFALEEERWKSALGFALIVGLVMGGIAWRVAGAGDHHADEGFWLAAGVVSIALALPLFQAGFHRFRWRTSYEETHYHVWTDAISAGGALAFTGIAWALIAILGALFAAIKITLLQDVLDEGAFGWAFSGLAFGAALGVLRNQLKIIGTLQSVVMLVLSLLAVPLAVALVLFLIALLLSGIDVLWDATESATPLLLACAVGSFVLVNAVVRDTDAAASGSRIQRLAAFVLAMGVLPLALLAAISLGTRIAQHGLSPERIWALIAIAVAVAYGAGYFVAALRGRKAGWRDQVRQSNLHLAAGTCVLAFLLAMPLFDFGAISARDQLARLRSGEVAVEDFDFAALRWDFGDAGRDALARLAKGEGEVAELAASALLQKQRPYGWARATRIDEDFDLRIQPANPETRALVLRYLKAEPYQCREFCVALDLGAKGAGRDIVLVQGSGAIRLNLRELDGLPQYTEQAREVPSLKRNSKVEIRSVEKRYVFIDGKPLDHPLD